MYIGILVMFVCYGCEFFFLIIIEGDCCDDGLCVMFVLEFFQVIFLRVVVVGMFGDVGF